MKTELNLRKDSFTLGAVIAALALMCCAMLTSKQAAAVQAPQLKVQKMDTILVVATRAPRN